MSAIVSAWVVTYLVHSTLLTALVLVASRWIRSASVRDTLWKLALLGGIATATLQLALPLERLVPRTAPQRMTMELPAATIAPQPIAPQPMEPVTIATDVQTPPAAQRRVMPIGQYATIAYAFCALLLIARIAVGRRRFLAAIGRRVEILRGRERELLDRLARTARLRRPVRLSESSEVASPVAMLGWEIVIPTDVFARLSDDQRETILAHEVAHLARRDALWLTIAEVVKAILWFQPMNWLVQARMKETAEFLCDDAAVLHTGNPRALAETLAELATSFAPRVVTVAAMAEGGSHLIERVTRVLRATPESPLRWHSRVAIALLVLATTAAFAPGMIVRETSDAKITITDDAPAIAAARRAVSQFSPRTPESAARAQVSTGTDAKPASRAVLAERAAAAAAAPEQPSSVAQLASVAADAVGSAVRELTDRDVRTTSGSNYFRDGELNRHFQGPEGDTRVELVAHEAGVSEDASLVQFGSTSGYIRVHQTVENGTKRDIEITPGRDGQPVYRYRVNGHDEPWCNDARLILLSAFQSDRAYTNASATRSKADAKSTWNATIELTGTRDGLATYLNIVARDVRYDADGVVQFDSGSSVHVEERVGTRTRTTDIDADGNHYSSNEDDQLDREERASWLRGLLRKNTTLPPRVIDAIARQ
ncbi:MAG TPA: M56 family metallopeptidase [Thermoanaerobaculia bacterium]|jgi:beta-lactamase regulating signal transducer with metallopeptidase domain